MSFVQRLIKEKEELDAKLEKLQDFMEKSPIYKALEQFDQELLEDQDAYMEAYSATLEKRIKRFS